MITKYTFSGLATITLASTTALSASAGSLTATTTVISETQPDGVVDISVYPGAAAYRGNLAPLTPLGDGTAEDYVFYTQEFSLNTLTDDGVYAQGKAELIGPVTFAQTDPNGHNAFEIWETTDPEGFEAESDFNGDGTAIRAAEATGTIDVSGLTSGTVYVFYGTYEDANRVSATLSGPDQEDLKAESGDQAPLEAFGDNELLSEWYVTAFEFNNEQGQYTTLTFNYEHDDVNDSSPGSRARFAGVVVDAVGLPE